MSKKKPPERSSEDLPPQANTLSGIEPVDEKGLRDEGAA